MSRKTNGAAKQPAQQENDVLDNEPVELTPEEQRIQTRAEIREIIRQAGGTVEQADQLIDADATVEEARSAAYDLLTRRSDQAPRIVIRVPGPSPEQTRAFREEGLAVRIAGGTPSDGARAYVGFSLRDHASDILEAQGIRTRGMNPEQIFTRAMHTTSDFSDLLTGVGARMLKPAYEAASSPLVSLARKVTASDFRTQSMLQLGEMPLLQKVTESGEIKSVTRGEAKETWALDSYGSIFSISRRAFLNDDLNAFADFATAAGQAAANTVADLLVTTLVQSSGAGPTMGDTVRLFHTSHGNINTDGRSINRESVSDGRVALRTMTGVDGSTLINVRPDTLIVAPSNETDAEAFLSASYPTTSVDANPFAERLKLVVEPRLEAVNPWDWYLVDSRFPALVLGGLAGFEGPQIASRDGFEVLGREFRVTLDVGTGPNEWRGWYRFGGHTDSNSSGPAEE